MESDIDRAERNGPQASVLAKRTGCFRDGDAQMGRLGLSWLRAVPSERETHQHLITLDESSRNASGVKSNWSSCPKKGILRRNRLDAEKLVEEGRCPARFEMLRHSS